MGPIACDSLNLKYKDDYPMMCWCLAALVAVTVPTSVSREDGVDVVEVADGSAGFHAFLEGLTYRSLKEDPEVLTLLGLQGIADEDPSRRMTDVSLNRREALRSESRRALQALRTYDRSRLSGQARWSHDLAVWYFRSQSDLMSFDWSPAWRPAGGTVYAVDQLFSIPVATPGFMANQHAIQAEADAEDYVVRLGAVARKLDQVGANFDMQMEHGVVPPAVALQGAADQIRSLVAPSPENSFFVETLRAKLARLEGLEAGASDALLQDAAQAVIRDVNPAYQRLLTRIERALEQSPPNRGVWALPRGDAYYEAALRWNTSTDLDADTIHQVGLDEVARIERELDEKLDAQGLDKGTVGQRLSDLARDPRFTYSDSEEGRERILRDIESALARIEPQLPDYFARLPEQPLVVRRVPAHAEATAPGGTYYPPAMDGSRPGTYLVNLGDVTAHARWRMPTVAFHEGSPGHHFQISLAQTLDDLPFLRRNLNPSAFTEGWALYAEQLASEIGVYEDDPFGDIGRLQAELFRAVRLVVDTGLHRKRWTPERAEAYMLGKTGMPTQEVRIEINRYLVQPGQASSYKMGHIRIQAMRARAKKALGDRFDLRKFHDVILGNGALPLLVLDQVVDEWIETEERRAGP